MQKKKEKTEKKNGRVKTKNSLQRLQNGIFSFAQTMDRAEKGSLNFG